MSKTAIKRSANFSFNEETILLSLVKRYKETLENKKTDGISNNAKAQCWKKVESLFNNESGQVYRDWTTLKKKYENMKKQTKKKVADEKCQVMGTGGGPPQKSVVMTDVEMEIKEILGTRIDGLSDEFGGDSEKILIEVCESGVAEETADEKENTVTQDFSEDVLEDRSGSVTKNWANYTPHHLKTQTSAAITPGISKTKRRNEYDSLCGKVTQWAGAKSALENEKIKYIQEEHSMKLSLMKQKTDAEIESLKRVTDMNIKKIESETSALLEEHNMKLEILKLEKHVILHKIKEL